MQLRFAICIPVFNHPKTVNAVINECLQHTQLPIFVVDDGSDISVEDEYKKQNPGSDRISFIRHQQNTGKGSALQTAFKKAVEQGFTHLVTIDADGQHLPEEILKLVAASYQNPWALILGDRKMNTPNVPKSSVFGKAFSNFWVEYQTDHLVGDSQSGFRIYPLFYVQTMSFLTTKYDFEIEIITRLIWKNVQVVSVPVTVNYFPPEKRVTHFNKFRDNLRLTVLNTILVSASLLRRKDSALKSSLAVAIGIFVGVFPFYGLHTLIVAGLAFAFRMNFIYLWLGTQISIPPMVPFLVIGSKYAAEWYLGHPPAGVFGLSGDWYEGITLVALACAFIGFLLTLFFKYQRVEEPQTKVSVKSKDGLGVLFLRLILKYVGLRATYFFLYFIVPHYYVFSFRARKSCNEYWKVIRPEQSFLKRQVKILQQILVFAKILVDRAYQKQFEKQMIRITEGDGVEAFKAGVKDNKQGSVVQLSHLGGWEVAMTHLKFMNAEKKMMAVMFGIEGSYQHTSEKLQGDNLQIAKFNFQQDTVLQLKKYLEIGELVGLMGDRPVGRSYELVPFLGKLGLFDTSAIRLAQISQAKIFFVFCVKTDLVDYRVTCFVPTALPEGFSRDEKTTHILKDYVNALEKTLNDHPEQWFNFFPFWSETLL